MGIVYRARRDGAKEPVAVKLLSEKLAEDSPAEPRSRAQLVQSHFKLAAVSNLAGRHQEARGFPCPD